MLILTVYIDIFKTASMWLNFNTFLLIIGDNGDKFGCDIYL